MKLAVLPDSTTRPWYADGLQFTCTQCGNCCSGGPGYVWLSREEVIRLADHLKLTPEQTVEQYCRKIDGRFSLKETRGAGGSWDCIFLREEKSPTRSDRVSHPRRTCSIYPVRPQQCRTWPFWESNLRSQDSWNRAAVRCYGMNRGEIHSLEKIKEHLP